MVLMEPLTLSIFSRLAVHHCQQSLLMRIDWKNSKKNSLLRLPKIKRANGSIGYFKVLYNQEFIHIIYF